MTQITEALLLAELQHHVGQANGVHADELVRRITGQLVNTDMHTRRVRFLIKELRKQGSHICGTPTDGYFMAATPEELQRTVAFLEERAMTTLMQLSHMKNIALPELLGQLRLPT